MKYTNTSRILCLIFHGLIVAAFGALAIYYAVFVVPFFFTNEAATFSSHAYGLYLYLELAVIGITICATGVYGLIHAIKAMQDKRNDEPVVKSFVGFLCAGVAAAIFFFLNGSLFFQLLTAAGNVAFVIIVCVLLAVLTLIAVNIPMVRLFDGKDNSRLVASFVGTVAIALLATGVCLFTAYIGSLSMGVVSYSESRNTFLLIITLAFLLIGLLTFAAAFLMFKGAKQDSKLFRLGENIGASSSLVLGLALIFGGIFDIVLQDLPIHFIQLDGKFPGNYTFSIMLIVFGGVLFLAGIALLFMLNDKKTEEKLKKLTAGK